MKFLTLALALASLSLAQTSDSICDKYTKILFKDNSEENQNKLLETLVTAVLKGNQSATVNNKQVDGILKPANFGGEQIDLAPFFGGTKGKTANINGVATAGINFLDGGARQDKLLLHLFQVFASLTGCSKQGGRILADYAGNPSMFDVHRFMNLRKSDISFFNDMVGQAAVGLGVTAEDAAAVGKSLEGLFNIACAAPAPLSPKLSPAPQGFCLAPGCTVDPKPQCPPGVDANAIGGLDQQGDVDCNQEEQFIDMNGRMLPDSSICRNQQVFYQEAYNGRGEREQVSHEEVLERGQEGDWIVQVVFRRHSARLY